MLEYMCQRVSKFVRYSILSDYLCENRFTFPHTSSRKWRTNGMRSGVKSRHTRTCTLTHTLIFKQRLPLRVWWVFLFGEASTKTLKVTSSCLCSIRLPLISLSQHLLGQPQKTLECLPREESQGRREGRQGRGSVKFSIKEGTFQGSMVLPSVLGFLNPWCHLPFGPWMCLLRTVNLALWRVKAS